MKKIIDWLQEIEKRAGEIYSTAAERVTDDKEFSSFLSQLANDEMAHYHMLEKAAENLALTGSSGKLDIILDDKTVSIVEKPLNDLLTLLKGKRISRMDILQCIANAELSEWNEIFLYVIHAYSAKGQSKDIQYAAAAIQSHEKRIKHFFNRLPESIKPNENFLKLPKIWETIILVVDDDEALRMLMAGILGTLGEVETAANGKEALEKTKDKFFNVIVSDIDMPEMDGLDFFHQATQSDHRLIKHFIFCSGEFTSARKKELRKYEIPFLQKPFNIFELQKTAQKLIETAI